MKFETIAVHAGAEPDRETGAISPPLHLSTTFEHGPGGEIPTGYEYIRAGNPTQSRLEQALAAIEGGESSLVFSSGVAAGAAFLQAFPSGSHVIFPDDCYYHFQVLAREYLPRWGMEATFVDMGDVENVRRALRPMTRVLWAETPSNPLMKVTNLTALVSLAREVGVVTLVDSTFATPVLQRPLDLGCDFVLHSTTKYYGGHSDVQGGVLIFKTKELYFEPIRRIREILGPVCSPFNSWLVLRGLRSLACRIERHSANALELAQALAPHAAVEAVHYPGLPSHPGHEVAKQQMKGFGGMLSFRLKGGRDRAIAVASKVKLFVNATSLGGTESLIEHRASIEGPMSRTPQNLLRVSVGLEHADDLIEDLMQALG